MTNIQTNSKTEVYKHLVIIVCFLTLLFLGFFFIYLPWITKHGESVAVPNLQGKNMEEIEDLLDEKGLDYVVSDSVFKPNVAPLTVVSQYPEAGAKVKTGRKISITVITEEPPMVKLPRLVDMSLRSAEMQLESQGLLKGNIRYEPDLRQNMVISVMVAGKKTEAGALIAKGTKVDLVLGSGEGEASIEVPDVAGKTFEEAILLISGLRLKYKAFYIEDSPEPAGTVIGQNPAFGDPKLREGQVIDLQVAGPKPAEEEDSNQ
jgi:eukaryotic-like serine/threonine-protein kinase